MPAEAPTPVHRLLGGGVRAASAAFLRLPWYVQVLALWAGARAFSAAVFLAVAARQGENPWWGPSPGYLEFVDIWDSEWYRRIHDGGYPSTVPRAADGTAMENEWAFYALFPLVVRLVTSLGLGWSAAGALVATACGFGAALLIYRLFRLRAGHGDALWGTALVAVLPVSPILQVPYAESLNLLLLAAALYLLVGGRYLAALPVVALMCLSRPVGVPFAAAVGIFFAVRWLRRGRTPFPWPQAWRLGLLAVFSCAAALAWPVLAWLGTGDLLAYTDTEAAWRGGNLVPFRPWLDMAGLLFGGAGPAVLGLLVVLGALAFTSAPVRRLGPELALFCACYALYLFVFLNPQTSTFRLLLPLFPLALAAVTLSSSRAYRWSLVGACLALQVVWVTWLWRFTALPGGGDYPP